MTSRRDTTRGVPDRGAGTDPHGSAGYRLHLSSATREPEWDRFLSVTPGGHHLQSTYWAQVKSTLGWRALRVTARRDGQVCGGAQVLLRALPVVGAVGYVARGPVLGREDADLCDLILRGLHTVSRRHGVRFLVVQPPAGHEAVVHELRVRGFTEAGSLVEPHPTATVVTDLSQEEPKLLAAMRKSTRYNIGLARRRGVSVREGTEQDIGTFHRLLTMTSRRQGFPIPSERYFRDLLRVMAPAGHARVFLAEFEGQPLSAALVVAFGDTASLKRAAWSGAHGRLHPNDLLQWTVMRWAKKEGYRYYDFEGIDQPAPTPSAAGEPGGAAGGTVSTFKLGFGGEVVLSPGAYERIHNPVLRRGYDTVLRRLLDSAPGRWAVDTVRTGRTARMTRRPGPAR